MKTIQMNQNSENLNPRRQYTEPTLDVVRLDSDISLALESTPPIDPWAKLEGESYTLNQPFRDGLV
jgi:hypothetical protein